MATTTKNIVTVHDRCQVAPPADVAASEKVLPLTFFDIVYIHFLPMQRLLFYKSKTIPCSASHLYETIVPSLKNSLSQTLRHYLPLAGNLYVPLIDSGLPELRYVPGDSVSFTVAESSHDLNYLARNKAREADEFCAFLPHLPEPKIESDFKRIPLLALQVTLFPESGICIGFSHHHAVGDASSIVGFIKTWSAIARFGGDIVDVVELPIYDRSLIKDPSGRRANIFWNQMKHSQIGALNIKFPTNKVRETYIILKDEVTNLRNLVLAQKQQTGSMMHLSSFTITTAYVWSCLAKAAGKIGENVDGDEPEYYTITADVRHRLDPPIPAAYFGNCLAFAVTEMTHGELKGEDGFFKAVEVVSKLISERVNNKEEIFRGADEWLVKYGPLFAKRIFKVAGSPRFDVHDADFGWGKPDKYESVSIRGDGAMSLCQSREFEGGLEIGLCLPKTKMDAFDAIFYGGLKI